MKILVVTRIWSFMQDTVDVWRKRGDTVIQAAEYNAKDARDVDVIFFEFVDKELIKAAACPVGQSKKIIARLHRIEYYQNFIGRSINSGMDWKRVHALIVTGKYFHEMIMRNREGQLIKDKTRVIHIRYGVNTDRFKFRKRKGIESNFTPDDGVVKIGWLAKGFYWHKNPIKALSCLKAMIDRYPKYQFKLYIAAGGGDRGVPEYWDYLYRSQPGLNTHVVKARWQNDVDKYFEPMDYVINTSHNESFCFVIAEALAKGIKTLLWDFESANYIWPREWTFFTHDEMFNIINSPYDSEAYRKYVIDNFSLDAQIKAFDELMK